MFVYCYILDVLTIFAVILRNTITIKLCYKFVTAWE